MKPDARARRHGSPVEATVIASLPNRMFRLRLSDGRQVTAHAAQNTRMAFVRLVEGDVVEVETSPFDPGRARILALTGKQDSIIDRPTAPSHNPFSNSERPLGQREEP